MTVSNKSMAKTFSDIITDFYGNWTVQARYIMRSKKVFHRNSLNVRFELCKHTPSYYVPSSMLICLEMLHIGFSKRK